MLISAPHSTSALRAALRTFGLSSSIALSLAACSSSTPAPSASSVATSAGGAGGLGGGGGASGGAGTGSGGEAEFLNGGCRTGQDCPDDGSCVPPGESDPACGIPAPDTCMSDAECASMANGICDGEVCGGRHCVPGCADDSACSPSMACQAGHRCGPKPCAKDSDCPEDFACVAEGGTDRVCRRQQCTSRTDCAHHCVNGECYESLGSCSGPPAG